MQRFFGCLGTVSLMLMLVCHAVIPAFAEQSDTTRVSPTTRFMNIAHRGARSVAPENTLIAFQIGVRRHKADMIELDVHLSKDGTPVVVHDDTLERCSDVAQRFPERRPWLVADFTLAELTTLDAGSWFVETDPFGQIAAGNVPEKDLDMFRSGRIRIPTLRGVLYWCKYVNCLVNIELKNFPMYYPELAERVLADVHMTGMADNVLFSSFDHHCLMEMKRLAPSIPRAALIEQPIFPFAPYVCDQLGAVAVNPWKAVLGFDSLAWRRDRQVRNDFLAAAEDAGLAVFVWTVNDSDEMQVLIDAGVSGIFTDFPQRLHALLPQ